MELSKSSCIAFPALPLKQSTKNLPEVGAGVEGYLVEVVQSLVQVGMHPSWRFICDFDGILKDTLWYQMAFRRSCRFCTDKDPEIRVTTFTVLL